MPEIPERLKRNGRPPDQQFTPEEKLYRRVPRPDFIDSEGFLTPAGVPFPDLSVNREKYSDPDDVLLDEKPAVAIAVAQVKDIPPEIDDYRFLPVHVPLEDNFAHSEVRTFRDGAWFEEQPPSTVKTEFRLSFRMKVLRRL